MRADASYLVEPRASPSADEYTESESGRNHCSKLLQLKVALASEFWHLAYTGT